MTDAVAPTRRFTSRRVRANAATLFAIGILLGGLVIFAGNTDLKKGDNGGTGPAIFSGVLLVVLAGIFWYVVLPRVKNVDRTVIIISVVAILSIAAFWLGITPLLAAAALAVGAKARQLGKTALVLQAVTVVAALATVVISIIESRVF